MIFLIKVTDVMTQKRALKVTDVLTHPGNRCPDICQLLPKAAWNKALHGRELGRGLNQLTTLSSTLTT